MLSVTLIVVTLSFAMTFKAGMDLAERKIGPVTATFYALGFFFALLALALLL